ncbi:hypothetical protein [Photobacterium leiognathi]|uniref:hypothetical protein n=1 Tax=Photobacterium leiognathi TaxID=553611 RepID=UPI002732D410|nr:hypothetical protein [Photobacterium leiognathi]
MNNSKKALELIKTENLNDLSFQTVLSHNDCVDIIKSLIFIMGYNVINVDYSDSGDVYFYAGLFPEDLDEKLVLKGNSIEGKLSSIIETTFNLLLDIEKQSNILDLYPREMRDEIRKEILKKNGVEEDFFRQISMRLI